MHEYPFDHPLQRIALAYFENNADETGIRYAFEFLNEQLCSYDLDPQEFEDCVDLIINEILYNESETLVAAVLHTLSILVIREHFPEAYREAVVERLSMIERLFRHESVALTALVRCLFGIWAFWKDNPVLQARARALLGLLGSDDGNVHGLKALARGLGAALLMPQIEDEHVQQCLTLIQDTLRHNNDWRIRIYVIQALSLAIQQGFIVSEEKQELLIEFVEGFLDEPYAQSLYKSVAEFLSNILRLGDLDDTHVDHCWNLLFKIPTLINEGATQCSTLHHLGTAMHWKGMNPAQEDQCYTLLRTLIDEAREEKTLKVLMVVMAQAIAGMYSWGRIESLQRWGGLFRELLLEVEPLSAYTCLNTFLRGPMAAICFTEEHLSQLMNDVLAYAESNEEGRMLCIQILDSMVASGFMNSECSERYWRLLCTSWREGQTECPSYWEYLAHSASGLVTGLKASERVRTQIFEEIIALFETVACDENKRLPLAQAFPVFVSLSERLPLGAFERSIDRLISWVGHSSDAMSVIALDGIEAALLSSRLSSIMRLRIAEVVLSMKVDAISDALQPSYVHVCKLLEGDACIPDTLQHKAKAILAMIASSSKNRSILRLVVPDRPCAGS
jgi:hypothetical protein